MVGKGRNNVRNYKFLAKYLDLVYKTTRVTTRGNTTQHEYNARQHNTIRVKHNTSKTRDNTSALRYNTSTTRPNTSTKEAQAAKIGLYIALFVTELYFFLVS